jgi:hypothetical protein
VLLSDIEAAAAPRFDADRKNDFLRWTARVHATDNYEQEGWALRQQRQPDRLQSAPRWRGLPVRLVRR